MTHNEIELINLIRTHPTPDKALETALHIMIGFLEQREVPQGTSFEHPPVTDETH